ncbi:restriction endonuclease [Acidisphaera sp. S103]|uniref:restriction endonuclease n=1 Tax=Acidisphaera sp. S103 TaxID=1747223 RepID=UPI00131A8FC7|nr:restriction endonuclease [Acidisphaera sp. S103]
MGADELRQREFSRLASFVVPTLEALRSLTPRPFRVEVAHMMERLGYEVITGEDAAYLVTLKTGAKHLVACGSPATFEPTPLRDLARLHDAVIAANAVSGFFVTARRFTPEAEAYAATAPLKLVDGKTLVASMQRSREGMIMPETYAAMCRQCGEIVKHRLDCAEAIPCTEGHPVPPTIALAALIAPKRSDGSGGDDAAPKQSSRFEVRQHNAKFQARMRRGGTKPKQ